MEWHEVNDPPDEHSFDDRRVHTVLALKDSRIEELKSAHHVVLLQLERSERIRVRQHVDTILAVGANLSAALYNLGIFDALV